MKKLSCILIAMAALTSCLQQKEQPAQAENNIIDNLPVSDRDLLLEPLERALDDVREMIDIDESYFAADQQIEWQGTKGTMKYKMDGGDTVMLTAELSDGETDEYHEWFSDKEGRIFYSFH